MLVPPLVPPLVAEAFERHVQGLMSDVVRQVLRRAFGVPFSDEGWATALRAYPVLAELARRRCALAVEATIEGLARVEDDRALLGLMWAGDRDPGEIAAIRFGASDVHDGGRTTWALGFASGLEVFYKPRDLGAAVAFGDLLGALAEPRAPLLPRAPAVLTRSGYGWTRAVRPSVCADEAAAGRFHERAGALVALAHMLGAGDLHRENVVAGGEVPTLVDCETLVGGGLFVGQAEPEAWSVLDTGLLPDARWPGLGCDTSVLGRGDGTDRPSGAHVEDVVRGYLATWRHLQQRAGALTRPGGAIDRLLGTPRRSFLRPSQAYALMLRRLHEPDLLEDVAARDLAIDRLLQGGAAASLPRAVRDVVIAVEREALLDGDVPRFCYHPADRTLRIAGRICLADVEDVWTLERVHTRLTAMTRADLQCEANLIRDSLSAAEAS